MLEIDPRSVPPAGDASAAELMREAISEARNLVRLELLLAKDDLKREVVVVRRSAIALGIAAVALILALALLGVALSLAIFPGPLPALLMGLLFLVLAAGSGALGARQLPRRPLGSTRKRWESDFDVVKESVVKERAV